MQRMQDALLGMMLLITASCPLCAAEKERVYKGKTVRQWIAELKNTEEYLARIRILTILGEMGPDAQEAVPVLIEIVRSDAYHYHAIVALGDIGQAARSAVPALIDL